MMPCRALSVVLACAALMAGVASRAPAAEPPGKAYTYKKVGDRELKLYVLNPADAKPGEARPAVVFFHGGGWVGGGPSQFSEHSEYLVTRGLVCVQVEYRLLDRKKPDEPPTVCIQDAKSAMRWVRSHAAELGIDPQRIASAGGSAGGHLAAFVGMVDGVDDPQDEVSVSARSNAMLLFNPVFDNGPDGWGHGRTGDRYKEFSPAHNVSPDDPPAIVFLGTKDKLIPVKTVKDFQAAMEKAGVRCDVHLYEGQPHGFFNSGKGGKYYYLTTIEADKFLGSLGWIEGAPTMKAPE
ncbi:MAG: alpha/beta hydrolase [Planctomycetota bacterium]